MKKTNEEIIAEMQQVVAQMVTDDLEENPNLVDEYFDCDCCGKSKCLAGSIQYGDYRLCNDCVLLAETGFALGNSNKKSFYAIRRWQTGNLSYHKNPGKL